MRERGTKCAHDVAPTPMPSREGVGGATIPSPEGLGVRGDNVHIVFSQPQTYIRVWGLGIGHAHIIYEDGGGGRQCER